MDDFLTYQCIQHTAQVSLPKRKGSRFIGYCTKVQDEQEAHQALAKIKKTYHDATHHCFLYKTGIHVHQDLFGSHHVEHKALKASDDGEPGSTATNPMKTIIEANHLQNILLVVIRYFGGTKLGIGGLISAYTDASKAVINKAGVVSEQITQQITIRFAYQEQNLIRTLQKKYRFIISNEQYEEHITYYIRINILQKDALIKEVSTSTQIEIIEGGTS